MISKRLDVAKDRREGPPAARRPPPSMALRTYLALRLSAVGVIAVLAASLIKESSRAGDCLQGSISAYYFTTVQSVFVGGLVTLGLVMIVLWGKTPWEDGALNLAGLLAPVVAFVPTAPSNLCSLTTPAGSAVKTEAAKDRLVAASHDGIFNNMLAYLVVVGLVLIILAAFGFISYSKGWPTVTEHPVAFWFPWALAVVLWLLGAYAFMQHREWFYENAHGYAAVALFAFIIVALVNIGLQKKRGLDDDSEAASRWWAGIYLGVATLMFIGAVLIYLLAKPISDGFGEHRTFIIESWLIFWLAIFWLAQTWDRRHDGAPPRTKEDLQRTGLALPPRRQENHELPAETTASASTPPST